MARFVYGVGPSQVTHACVKAKHVCVERQAKGFVWLNDNNSNKTPRTYAMAKTGENIYTHTYKQTGADRYSPVRRN